MIQLPRCHGVRRSVELRQFAEGLIDLSNEIGFKISPRGWGYQLETLRLINKNQFDLVERVINECRKEGYLPVDFVAEEEARAFSGVEEPTDESPEAHLKAYLETALCCEETYTPDWWEDEEYYIQMLVEKIDLKTLFEPVCRDFHIPIATAKGWSSILQRAEYARRFMEAEGHGMECVLLYCGDFDPDGGRISDFIIENLEDLTRVNWSDGEGGYDPRGLTIDRFGLNKDFIDENGLTWIDNLITGSGQNLADPNHKHYHMAYVQDWIRDIGVRKCEANALVVRPDAARQLCRDAIEKYLGDNALERFDEKKKIIAQRLKQFRERTGLLTSIQNAIKIIETEEAG